MNLEMAVERIININSVVERVPMIIYFECMENKMYHHASLSYLPSQSDWTLVAQCHPD